jgi:protein TonB
MTTKPSVPSAPILTAPITVRPSSRNFMLRRGLLIGFTFGLHVALIAGIVLADLLVIEVMKPPRAATHLLPFFRVPGPAGGGGGGAKNAPRLQVPPPKPVVFALPPPAANPVAGTIPAPLANAGPGDGATPGPGGPGGGHGPGPGIGDGPAGPDGPDGPGVESQDGPYPEGHPDITPPVLIASSRVYPRYPELARKAGVQASVILLVVIDAAGRVGSIEVMSAPDPRYGFDLATIEAVKQWRYRPALLGGRPVAVQASITFEFSISR